MDSLSHRQISECIHVSGRFCLNKIKFKNSGQTDIQLAIRTGLLAIVVLPATSKISSCYHQFSPCMPTVRARDHQISSCEPILGRSLPARGDDWEARCDLTDETDVWTQGLRVRSNLGPFVNVVESFIVEVHNPEGVHVLK